MRSLARFAPRARAAARSFAADAKPPAGKAAAAAAEVEVPLKLFGLPARYASALFVAASKAAALPTVEKELATVVELANTNATFGSFLADPSLTNSEKLKGIASITEGGKFSATTKQFFGACARARQPAAPAGARGPACLTHLRPRLQPCWRRTGGWARRGRLRTSSRSS